MKLSGGESDGGIVVGNTFDKYGSRNPIVQRMMKGFEISLEGMIDEVQPDTIHETGCGEGFWVMRWHEQGRQVRGTDFSTLAIELAANNAADRGISQPLFTQRSIYELTAAADSADLIVCCEVLEHLENPGDALKRISGLDYKNAIFSVPREPLWSCLNLARGKYWSDWGNTPGHIQRWSRQSFVGLISQYFEVVRVETPLPWTMLLCRPPGKTIS